MASSMSVPTRETPAHTAYMAYCIANKIEPSDESRRAYMVGWYDGRIALFLENMQHTANAVTREKMESR